MNEGPKRSRDLPEIPSDFLLRLVNREFLRKDVEETMDKQEVYRRKHTYSLTDKSKRLYEQ